MGFIPTVRQKEHLLPPGRDPLLTILREGQTCLRPHGCPFHQFLLEFVRPQMVVVVCPVHLWIHPGADLHATLMDSHRGRSRQADL